LRDGRHPKLGLVREQAQDAQALPVGEHPAGTPQGGADGRGRPHGADFDKSAQWSQSAQPASPESPGARPVWLQAGLRGSPGWPTAHRHTTA
jgi:hypothetical protein